LDPFYNAIHVALQRRRSARTPELDEHHENLANKLFQGGPAALTAEEKRALLSDGPALAKLHILVWRTPAEKMNPFWAEALRAYRNEQRAAVSS
jgi:membrane glycosyltransferase